MSIIEHLLSFDDDDDDGKDTRKESDRMSKGKSMNEPIWVLFAAHIWALYVCVCFKRNQYSCIFIDNIYHSLI